MRLLGGGGRGAPDLIYIYIYIYIWCIFGPPFGPWTPGPILVGVAIFMEYVYFRWKSVFVETLLLVHVSEEIIHVLVQWI